MSSCNLTCKEHVRQLVEAAGAFRCRFASAGNVDDIARLNYELWIKAGRHGSMLYCEKYNDVRDDPKLLLPDAKTIICAAFNYHVCASSGLFAEYAHGADYHYVIKHRLAEAADHITSLYGGECRVCVDTAPIRERYWAQKAGIGFIGLNNQLIIPEMGSKFFLAEILWTGMVEADAPLMSDCGKCMRCINACPGKALDGNGGCDASKCVSYLTIEHRGDLPDGCSLAGNIYGCDICQNVCPHNQHSPETDINEFLLPNPLIDKSEDDILKMTSSQYKKLTAKTAISRVPLKQLIRNINCASHKEKP